MSIAAIKARIALAKHFHTELLDEIDKKLPIIHDLNEAYDAIIESKSFKGSDVVCLFNGFKSVGELIGKVNNAAEEYNKDLGELLHLKKGLPEFHDDHFKIDVMIQVVSGRFDEISVDIKKAVTYLGDFLSKISAVCAGLKESLDKRSSEVLEKNESQEIAEHHTG